MSTLRNLEKSLLKKGSDVAETGDHIIKDYEVKDYVKKLPKKNEQQGFLPHKLKKIEPQQRYVSSFKQFQSLNDAILLGLKLQNEIMDVLYSTQKNSR